MPFPLFKLIALFKVNLSTNYILNETCLLCYMLHENSITTVAKRLSKFLVLFFNLWTKLNMPDSYMLHENSKAAAAKGLS